MLAGRYRLDDLLSETGRGRFWRGYDQVLSRAVAIHVIDADDERAARLMEAARASAQVAEPRLLRVLDIENDGRICYVVNEWGQGVSLDHLVAREGPLLPRRAAWIVAEVAAALETAHERGIAHGRLNPENVLIDTTGAVRIIGFAVEAALFGLAPDRIGTDVVDLAGLLQFALTGKWAGASESAMPRAPREQHGAEYRVLRPRQIRAGVPRVLDDLADEVLNRPHGRHAGPNTARELHEILSAYVGDRNGLSDELADTSQTAVVAQRPPAAAGLAGGSAAGSAAGSAPAAGSAAGAAADSTPDSTLAAGLAAGSAAGAAAANATGTAAGRGGEPPTEPTPTAERAPDPEPEATVAGLPVFDDTESSTGTDRAEGAADPAEGAAGTEWLTPREDIPAPPPPLEPPPERPLFAPDPGDGSPVRRARPSATPPPPPEPLNDSASFWPFDATPEEPPVPGRRWLRLGLGLVLLVLLVLGGIVVAQLQGDHDTTPSAGSSGSPSASGSATPAAHPISALTVKDFDPFGNPPAENSDLAPRAVDGDPATTWRTSTYLQNLGPGGIKSGVGLIVDLHATFDVSRVRITFIQPGTHVSIYVGATAPTSGSALGKPAVTATAAQTAVVPITPAARGRYVTLWFTSLPQVTGGFRTEVAEVSVAGTQA
ncbi:hypothetical protein JCM18899A_40200 [Nocardioides sp. AN3]